MRTHTKRRRLLQHKQRTRSQFQVSAFVARSEQFAIKRWQRSARGTAPTEAPSCACRSSHPSSALPNIHPCLQPVSQVPGWGEHAALRTSTPALHGCGQAGCAFPLLGCRRGSAVGCVRAYARVRVEVEGEAWL